MTKFSRIFLISSLLLTASYFSHAQVNSVEFGRNRVQYKKFKWRYYQTKNFNVYFYDNGEELAKFIAQSAEKELPQIEAAAEYSLQRRANIVLYNEYADMRQSNIGLGIDWQNQGGTKLVNNKMVVYFDADHSKLRLQVRHGISQVITENRLFGDDLGEVAGNQALLDLPKWLTDGYIDYLAENWSTDLDDELKSEILSGNYSTFTRFAFERPKIAGHAFWYYIEEKYKKENVTYLLYLSTVYKSLNKATMQVCKKKFKEVLADFMEYNEDKYYKDITRRKPYPKGSYIDGFDISPRLDYFRFNVNPNKRNNSYVVTQYRKGIVRVIFNDDFENKTILKFGVRSYKNEINPNYPMMAWDPKGTRFTVLYSQEGKLKLFVYDVVNRQKQSKMDLTQQFDQVEDMKYMLNSNTLLLSAVKNGHTDIYTLDLRSENVKQITNDVYDDLDPSFVAFPNKTGIIFSSNRPNPAAKTADTVLPSDNHYNIFLISNFGDKPELNQITQLSKLKYGNARYPMQYNTNHFTFVSDENGVGNRYAGFFTTEKAGLDTLVLIGADILRNPSAKEVDSALKVYNKTDVDSIAVVSVSNDSAYTFPLTNYQSTLGETRIAGDNNQVSEVTRQSDEKVLYKLKIDENVLRRRNITAQPTEYMKKKMAEYDVIEEKMETSPVTDTSKKQDDFFQTEFANEKKDSSYAGTPFNRTAESRYEVLRTIKQYPYKPKKFYIESGAVSFFNNSAFGAGYGQPLSMTKYQPYSGSGPINLGASTNISGFTKVSVSDLMEDIKLLGAFRIASNLKDAEWLASYQNLRRRIDWGFTFYRKTEGMNFLVADTATNTAYIYPGRQISNLYQGNLAYPLDENKSIRFTTGVRADKFVLSSVDSISIRIDKVRNLYSLAHLEYVYDNTQNPTMNIWHGLRYKIAFDWNSQINKQTSSDGPNTFNLGFDARYYYPIWKNFIWAGRAAGDFSFGNQKIIYYLGGIDSWLMLNQSSPDKYFNFQNAPAPDQDYAYQSLAVNMRGFKQNIANGNNAVVLNSEFRFPVFASLFNRPINNAFLRNFQIIQFFDLGSAWNGQYNGIKRPEVIYGDDPVQVRVKAGGLGPFAGGYGFGARSTLLGYFVKFDAGWEMKGFFKGKPILYLSLGLDF